MNLGILDGLSHAGVVACFILCIILGCDIASLHTNWGCGDIDVTVPLLDIKVVDETRCEFPFDDVPHMQKIGKLLVGAAALSACSIVILCVAGFIRRENSQRTSVSRHAFQGVLGLVAAIADILRLLALLAIYGRKGEVDENQGMQLAQDLNILQITPGYGAYIVLAAAILHIVAALLFLGSLKKKHVPKQKTKDSVCYAQGSPPSSPRRRWLGRRN